MSHKNCKNCRYWDRKVLDQKFGKCLSPNTCSWKRGESFEPPEIFYCNNWEEMDFDTNKFRRIIYLIDLQELLLCIKGKICAKNLPEDTKIIAAYFKVEQQCLQLILESEKFPENFPTSFLQTRKLT